MTETAARLQGLRLPAVHGRRNLRDEVLQALRAAVVSGEMRPGVVYSAPALAAGFGVSATRQLTTDPAEDGVVLSQTPGGGRQLEEGANVSIVVGKLEREPPPGGDDPAGGDGGGNAGEGPVGPARHASAGAASAARPVA